MDERRTDLSKTKESSAFLRKVEFVL